VAGLAEKGLEMATVDLLQHVDAPKSRKAEALRRVVSCGMGNSLAARC
jgi:hypothetical protein